MNNTIHTHGLAREKKITIQIPNHHYRCRSNSDMRYNLNYPLNCREARSLPAHTHTHSLNADGNIRMRLVVKDQKELSTSFTSCYVSSKIANV